MKEIRLAEIRANEAAAGNALILQGRPIVFNQATRINDVGGSYTEIIERSALDGADLTDVRLLVNHDAGRIPLARVPKTMSLTVDAEGLAFRAELPDTEAGREAYSAVQRGVITGMSFAFTVPDGGDRYDAATNTRTISKIAKVYECSLVNYPAYEGTTVSVEARGAKAAADKRYKAKQEAKILINQIRKAEV